VTNIREDVMEKSQRAREFFDKNANCAQSVLMAFAKDYGMDAETALRVATGFGGGMGRMGNVCGAVTGAFMAFGLARGMCKPEEQDKKTATYDLVREFSRRFTEKYPGIACKDLLGVDISTPEGSKAADAAGMFKTKCPAFVGDAADIVEKMLAEKSGK
jgi:C_GCAxxG_C_C family probable redox protein